MKTSTMSFIVLRYLFIFAATGSALGLHAMSPSTLNESIPETVQAPNSNARPRFASHGEYLPAESVYGHRKPLPHVAYPDPHYFPHEGPAPGVEQSFRIGTFDHAFHSELGKFSPDYYGPHYDRRSLPQIINEVMQRFRYKQVCT